MFQFYLNLTQANVDVFADWALEYTGTEYYGQPDMGTTSLNSIAQSLLDNDELFNKYYAANGVNYDPKEECAGECRYVHYCAVTELAYDAYEQCMIQLTGAGSSVELTIVSLVLTNLAAKILLN